MKHLTSEERKQRPIFSGVLKYFPNALTYLSTVSLAGNQQHHPDEPLHWDMSKSTDEPDALLRHLLDAGTLDDDGILHSGKVLWRAAAMLERELINTCYTEVFKDIPGWEGYYQVSNFGNVKSLSRRYSPNVNMLNPTESMDGYLKVSLRANGIHEQVEINRLVARTFIDKDYTEKSLVCDHIDRDKKNNLLSNLRVVTHRENVANNGSDKLTGAFKRNNGRFQANVQVDGHIITLGTFNTEQEAHNEYMSFVQKELEEEYKNNQDGN